MTKFRTEFDDPSKNKVFWTDPGEDEDLVQHHMAEECDINVIMRRYQQTGELTHVAGMAGEYGDFYDVTDYKTGTERLMAAQELFMELRRLLGIALITIPESSSSSLLTRTIRMNYASSASLQNFLQSL